MSDNDDTPAKPSRRARSQKESLPSLRELHKSMTRQRLIETAVEVFEEKGYQSTTVEDIATRANVSRTTFYLHFPSKRDVAIANGDQLLARIPSRFARLTSGRAVTATEAREFLDAILEMMRDDTQANIIALEANVADPGLTQKGWQDYLDLGQALLDAFLDNGWAARDEHAATHLAVLIPTINYALWGQGIFRLDPPSPGFMDVLSTMVTDAVARAVAPPSD